MRKVNEELRSYIGTNIFPLYALNDEGHNLEHIEYVRKRAFNFSDECNEDINTDMIYTVVTYHDVGHHIDAKHHEIVSAKILREDENLKKFFTREQIEIMAQAVEDHRASLEYEPRNIYGKIISSADRNTLVDVVLRRTYVYRLKHYPNFIFDEIVEESRRHIEEKFGEKGYASEKMYFEDLAYAHYLEEIRKLVKDKDEFIRRYKEVNHIGDKE